MKFKNKPNYIVKDSKGKAEWISRSIAVVTIVYWNDFYLILKRGKSVSKTNSWCSPCGYLDWDESILDCLKREIWEETGLNLSDYSHEVIGPYDVVSDPGNSYKQNVAFHYGVVINSPTMPILNTSEIDPNEVQDVKWINFSELSKFKFAFNHENRIAYFENKLRNMPLPKINSIKYDR